MSDSEPINYPAVFPADKDFYLFTTNMNLLDMAPTFAKALRDKASEDFKNNCMLAFKVIYSCMRIAEHYNQLAPSDGTGLIANELSAMFQKLEKQVVPEEHRGKMRDKLKGLAEAYGTDGDIKILTETAKQRIGQAGSLLFHLLGLCKEDHGDGEDCGGDAEIKVRGE